MIWIGRSDLDEGGNGRDYRQQRHLSNGKLDWQEEKNNLFTAQ